MVKVEDRFDLLALHRTIMEAKFHDPPSNEDVVASPILARIANAIVDEMIEIERREGRVAKAESWGQWRDVAARPDVVRVVIECARRSPHWAKQTGEEKEDYVRCGLSPILAGPEVIARLVDEVERQRAGADQEPR